MATLRLNRAETSRRFGLAFLARERQSLALRQRVGKRASSRRLREILVRLEQTHRK